VWADGANAGWGGGAHGNWKSELRILDAALLTDSGSGGVGARLCWAKIRGVVHRDDVDAKVIDVVNVFEDWENNTRSVAPSCPSQWITGTVYWPADD